MARKKRCSYCKEYFETESKQLVKYCTDECKKNAIAEERNKRYKKAVAKQAEEKPKKEKKRKQKTPRQIAKEDAWGQFSIYIRTRDCIRFTGTSYRGKCVTCDRPYGFKQLQAGHFIAGRGNAVLFDERIVYTQCLGCNGNPPYGKGGNYVEYFVFMEKEWGRDMIDEFRNLKSETIQYKINDFLQIKAKFERKTSNLLAKLEVDND